MDFTDYNYEVVRKFRNSKKKRRLRTKKSLKHYTKNECLSYICYCQK